MGAPPAVGIPQGIVVGTPHDMGFVLIYLDDILVQQKGGGTAGGHLGGVGVVLARLGGHGPKANLRGSPSVQGGLGTLGPY